MWWTLRWALAGCWCLAAAGKLLAGPSGVRANLRRYAVIPPRLERLAPGVLVGAELLAAATLVSPWPAVGAGLSVALGAVFAGVVSTATLRGASFSCGCFGPLLQLPVGLRLFALDLALVAAAAVLLLPPQSSLSSPGTLLAVYLSLLALGLLGHRARRQAVRPPTSWVWASGQRLPPFHAVMADNTPVSSADFQEGEHHLLFVSLECRSCARLLRLLRREWSSAGPLPALIVVTGSPQDVRERLRSWRLHWSSVLIDPPGTALQRACGVPGTPALVVIRDGHLDHAFLPADLRTLRRLGSSPRPGVGRLRQAGPGGEPRE